MASLKKRFMVTHLKPICNVKLKTGIVNRPIIYLHKIIIINKNHFLVHNSVQVEIKTHDFLSVSHELTALFTYFFKSMPG